MNQIPKHWRK